MLASAVTIFFPGVNVSIEPHLHRRAPTAMVFRKRMVAVAGALTLAEWFDGTRALQCLGRRR
jgi:hypothetical protein